MGGSPSWPPGLPWGFPMVFVVVVVVVVFVEFERWSDPVDGFGCTRLTSGVQLCCFCLYFTLLAISCIKNNRNVRWILDRKAKTARIYISNSGGEWGGVLLGHLASPGVPQWCLLLLLLLYLLNLRDGRVLWMDLGALFMLKCVQME